MTVNIGLLKNKLTFGTLLVELSNNIEALNSF